MNGYPLSWSPPPALYGGVLIAAPAPVAAAESAQSDDWQYAATLYLWGAGIDGETARDPDVSVNFQTLLDNLNMAFMGAFESRKGNGNSARTARSTTSASAAPCWRPGSCSRPAAP